jgi:hypothetical protein
MLPLLLQLVQFHRSDKLRTGNWQQVFRYPACLVVFLFLRAVTGPRGFSKPLRNKPRTENWELTTGFLPTFCAFFEGIESLCCRPELSPVPPRRDRTQPVFKA